ncbi:MAG: hypothetical protein ACFB0Z_09770 [Candidatus Phaeomarinobacter sp.]
MAKQRMRKATLQDVLVYLDEPQLVTLKSLKQKVVALAVDAEGMENAYFATTVTPKDWDRYLRGAVDLRYLFEYAKGRRPYIFDWVSGSEHIYLDPFTDEVPEDFLPAPRFFSRDHTEPDGVSESSLSEQSFGIDGEWELRDFSKFYSQYEDVYSLNWAVSVFDDQSTPAPRRRQIVDSFVKHPWRGGFSYVHFYEQLSNLQQAADRISVDRIQYNSPGVVVINGDEGVLHDANLAISRFEENFDEIKNSYAELHKYLSEAKLLKAEIPHYENKGAVADYIAGRTANLASLLGLTTLSTIRSLCGKNELLTAKVVLSYHRRVKNAFFFFAEGRITLDEDFS